MSELTAERVRELLSYDAETGELRWAVRRRRVKLGRIAGSITCSGYRAISIDRKFYRAHRLVWLYVHGRWPACWLDHINGVKDDNRIANLREATSSQNQHNRGKRGDNSSGYKGVYWDEHHQKWRAVIWTNSRRVHLGRFDLAEDAGAAYVAAAKALHGEFMRSS